MCGCPQIRAGTSAYFLTSAPPLLDFYSSSGSCVFAFVHPRGTQPLGERAVTRREGGLHAGAESMLRAMGEYGDIMQRYRRPRARQGLADDF